MTDKNARFEEAVSAMTKSENRFDVTIICTTDDHQADFWMTKLSAGLGGKEGELFPMVIAVSEDWAPSGAGNGLGTLYAWQKAVKLAKAKFDADLEAMLLDKTVSAALFHTAGKGTRMAPLPASENNNKPGVVRIVRHHSFLPDTNGKRARSFRYPDMPVYSIIISPILFALSLLPNTFIIAIIEIAILVRFHWQGHDSLGGGRPTIWHLRSFS